MVKQFTKIIILIFLFCGLPLSGIIIFGMPVEKHIQFPPLTRFVQHGSFSWIAFISISAILILTIFPILLIIIIKFNKSTIKKLYKNNKITWWGKTSIFLLIFFWIIAWGNFDLFKEIKNNTFIPLWLMYILLVNSMEYRITGKCLLMEKPAKFLFLFPASAVFWWYFEYLNTFVENWNYVGSQFSPLKLFIHSSLAFSTVLPAVLSTASLISKLGFIKNFGKIWPISNRFFYWGAWVAFIFACAGLFFIGIFPDYLFPFVWVSPFLIIVSIQMLFKDRSIISGIEEGDWRTIISAELAGVICGFFWEMWNFHSMPKWQYSIPFVDRFHIFEMPVLGYAGYLPFGLLCLAVVEFMGFSLDFDYQKTTEGIKEATENN